MTVPVRPMARDEEEEITAVSARAFWHDPLVDFFSRDPLHEYRLLPTAFTGLLADLRDPSACVWVAEFRGRPRGIAGWIAPGGWPRSRARDARYTARSLALVGRVRHRAKAARLFFEVERRHPREPHWYLALLATDPTAQGRGVGTALLRPVLDRCDTEGIPAYTETQKEANVAWYARSGFEVSDEIRLPGTPPVWCLHREPST